VKKMYQLKKHFRRSGSHSKDKISRSEKIRGPRRVDSTLKTRRLAMKKFVDEAARSFKAENTQKKTRHSKRNRKQVIASVAHPRRRHHRVKTLKRLKQSRTNTSKNALLEGLGYSTPSK